MANNNFFDFLPSPSNKEDARKKADTLISGLKTDEKQELQSILNDREKINEVLSSPAARKIMEKLNGKKMDINEILSSLTSDDIENLKATAESVFGQSGSQNSQNNQNPDSGSDIFSSFDPQMIARITRVMGAMNGESGRRCKLIEALKPNLSPERQKRADQAIQILKLLEILPLVNNLTERDDK